MISILKTIIYYPLYNFLILILNIPYIDIGIAVILITLIVKIILYPISKKTTITQLKMKEFSGELKEIKEKIQDKQLQAVKTMEFYKKHQINPFGGILSVVIQIPIIYSLYHILLYSGLPIVDQKMLYSFVKVPEISMKLLGFFDISQKSLFLAVLASVSTFLQMHLSNSSNSNTDSKKDSKLDMAEIMSKQMKYTFPIIVLFISWKISGVVALYWCISNLASILQDKIIKRSIYHSKNPQTAV